MFEFDMGLKLVSAVITAVAALILGSNPILFFILGMIIGPPALVLLLGWRFLFGGEKTPAERQAAASKRRVDPEILAPRDAKEAKERERIQDLLERMRAAERSPKTSSPEAERFTAGVAKILGKEVPLEAEVKSSSSRARSASREERASERASAADERAARRKAESETRARSRRESHRERHSKMPASGLSPEDPNFLRGYRPKNNRIP